jgi:hypothetical protein
VYSHPTLKLFSSEECGDYLHFPAITKRRIVVGIFGESELFFQNRSVMKDVDGPGFPVEPKVAPQIIGRLETQPCVLLQLARHDCSPEVGFCSSRFIFIDIGMIVLRDD